ncbi:hypothetical protein [Frankia sp. Cppng1_Ct_nod]|uniref:hypothetical protein n=1 Tax=Frankia sp. Cppng1_Ct_nod TaxID=2897162 RepID=UPI001041132C|nr:hypothetical protein [Frankia sp. Cppng1_Ct_nod]
MITSAWKPLDSDIREFLTEFERRGAEPESDSGEQFADQFVVADPNRAMVLAREAFVASLPYRRGMFETAGVGNARCVGAAQLDLDDRHVLVTSDWDADRGDEEPLRLESTFLLRREDGGPRILAYLNHRDIVAVLGALT